MCDRRAAQKHHDGPQAAPQQVASQLSKHFTAGSSIIYPAPSAKIGSKAPDFTLPGMT